MKKFSIASIIGMAMLILPLGLWAQDDDRASLSDVWLIMPKQGMATQFEDAARTHMAFREDAGETRNWETYGVALGSNPMLYMWRASSMEWADQDSYIAEDEDKGLGANWMANVDQYVDHYHHYIEEADYENSNWPADLGQNTYYGVTTWTWKQGGGPAADEARKQLSKIGLDEGWEYNWLWLERIGGEPQLMIVSPYENFAAMEPPENTFFELVRKKQARYLPHSVADLRDPVTRYGNIVRTCPRRKWREPTTTDHNELADEKTARNCGLFFL
jgi:hypothetical protein